MAYLPNRGDIVHLDFDPSSDRDGERPTLRPCPDR